jgi:hypothetical protein
MISISSARLWSLKNKCNHLSRVAAIEPSPAFQGRECDKRYFQSRSDG